MIELQFYQSGTGPSFIFHGFLSVSLFSRWEVKLSSENLGAKPTFRRLSESFRTNRLPQVFLITTSGKTLSFSVTSGDLLGILKSTETWGLQRYSEKPKWFEEMRYCSTVFKEILCVENCPACGKLLLFCQWLLTVLGTKRSRGTCPTDSCTPELQIYPRTGWNPLRQACRWTCQFSLWLSASSPACLWMEAWPTGPFPSPNLRLRITRALKNRRAHFFFLTAKVFSRFSFPPQFTF